MNSTRRGMAVLFQAACACALVLTSCLGSIRSVTRPPESACPGVLTYDERDPVTARSRWSASIEIRPEQPLKGFTLAIDLDKPADLLGNMAGHVTTRDNQHFHINTRKKLLVGVPSSIRIFVKHSSEVPRVEAIRLNGVQICPADETYFQTEPRRVLSRPGESVLLLGRVGNPLRYCHFRLPNQQRIDLSQGRNSTTTNRYEYYGRGLESGECGLRIKRVQDDNDGLITCEVMTVKEPAKWITSASTLRVTNLAEQELPVFEIAPRRKTLREGDDLTVTCNADRPLSLCHFHLPDQRVLDFDLGPDSEDGPDFRYHGSGLRAGDCGLTLSGVDPGLNGFVECVVGRGHGVTGAWQRDALKLLVTASPVRPDHSSPPPLSPTFNYDVVFPAWTSRASTVRPDHSSPPPASPTSDYAVLFPARTSPAPVNSGNIICGKAVVPLPAVSARDGQRTYRGQWPWHVALYQSAKNGSLVYVCGGSLIGSATVITAAHCVTKQPFDRAVDAATLMVHLGKYDLRQWSGDGLQERQVARVVVHPSYNRTGFNSDLAVLVLRSKADYTDYVRPVCLWDSTKTDVNEIEGRDGTIVGWGIDEQGYLSQELMKTSLRVVSEITCLYSRPDLLLTRNTSYCAGFRNGTSVCNGDSGGGMVFPTSTSRGTRWYLRGLISNRIPRTAEEVSTLVCDPRYYVVFTDLAQFLDWLIPFVAL